jgi:hypothetical protein
VRDYRCYIVHTTDPARPGRRTWHACPPVRDGRDAARIAEAYRASGQFEEVTVVRAQDDARMVRG